MSFFPDHSEDERLVKQQEQTNQDTLLRYKNPEPLLRKKISPYVNDLNYLHLRYDWIPNSNQIRPTDEIMIFKKEYLKSIPDMRSYILSSIFNVSSTNYPNFSTKCVFKENMFPYATSGRHYVLWYDIENSNDRPSDDDISIDISTNIEKIVSQEPPGSVFDFAWYVNPDILTNPERHISSFFHVHVFWIIYRN